MTLVHAERVGMTAGVVQRVHEELVRSLAGRFGDHEPFEPGSGVAGATAGEQRVGPVLFGVAAQLVESGRFGHGELVVAHVLVGGAVPQLERGVEARHRPVGVGGRRPARLVGQRLEP